MNVDSVTIRKAAPEDARGWETLGIQVWRDAYRHIFPEEVFLEKESRLEEKIARFNDWAKNDSESITYVAENGGITRPETSMRPGAESCRSTKRAL